MSFENQSQVIHFCPLVSGSSGNATYVGCGSTKVLIDCGESGKKIVECLQAIGIDPEQIQAIFLTHAHDDHVRGAGILSRRYDIPIYASIGTWEMLQHNKKIGDVAVRNMKVFQTTDRNPLDLGNLEVMWFPTPHDTPDPVGYRFYNHEIAVAIATDIGHASQEVNELLMGAAVVLLESNYDVQMLKIGPYTEYLKKRILSDFGHLSNDSAGIIAGKLLTKGTQRIYLGHLSRENNTPELAYQTVIQSLENARIRYIRETQILLANRYQVSRMTIIDSSGCQ